MRLPQVMRIDSQKLFILVGFAIIISTAAVTQAQESAAKRGFQAGGSFALSDIETINTTNGNMMLHMPLGSLPAGRNGLTAGINLLYSSKIYNSHTSWFRDYGKSCTTGAGEPAPQICPYYQRDELQQSADGGWRYAVGYDVEVVDRTTEGSMDPNMQCTTSGSDGFLPMTYRFKLKVHFPDGSVHEMRPYGYTDQNTNDLVADYYNIRPDGWIEDCSQGGHWLYAANSSNLISYYSSDGTYARLDFRAVSHDGWWNDPWTLYLPDGSRVTGGNAPQRIYDRNNNYIQINNINNYQSSGNHAVQVVDEFNRTVTLVYNGVAAGEDSITAQGFGDTLVWKVRWKGIRVNKSYWPCQDSMTPCQIHDTGIQAGPDTFIQALYVVDRITLPSQAGSLAYYFSYNAPDDPGSGPFQPSAGWGELSGVTLPSGAKATYDYQYDNDSLSEYTPDVMKNFPTAKHLVYRPEYDLGGGSPSNTVCNPQTETCITDNWTYGTADNNGLGSVTGPDGGVSTDYAVPTNYSVSWQYWNVGLVYKSVRPDGTMTERLWAKNDLSDYGGSSYRADNTYVKTEFTSIKSGSTYVKTAIKDYSYDKNGNVTRVAEYDWVDYGSVPRTSGNPTGIPSGAVPTRVTTTGYYNSTPDSSQVASGSNVYWHPSAPALKKAAAWSEVSDSTTRLSRSEITYDNYSTTGNVTQLRSWDSTKGAYSNPLTSANSVSVLSQYGNWSSGATGKLTQSTDGNGNVSRFTYGDIGNGTTDLYVTRAVTGDNAAGTSTIKRTTDHLYDFGTGAATRATDVDNNVYTTTIYDVFARPTLVKSADGKTEETRTAISYDDIARRVITRSDLNALGDGKLVSIQHYDQLGRIRLARQLEDASIQNETDESVGIKVQTRYLYSGSNSYILASNPYRASSSSGASSEPSMGWTLSTSDNGGRTISVQTFGGAILPQPWLISGYNNTPTGTVSTSYDANFTTVTDQAGKVRRSMTNGLGQLARVDEPDGSGSLGTTASPAQPTSYTYNALSNLTQVTQVSPGSQQPPRAFVYSSLGRLVSATNPESGTICYGQVSSGGECLKNGYDANGNLIYKTDARLVLTTYSYDALNRNTSVSYSDSTPAITRTYDSATNGKGRPAAVSSTVGSYTYDVYDALGRLTTGSQTIGNKIYTMGYSYNRASHVTTLTYPSLRTVTNNYDNAGRLSSVTGNLGDGTSRTYSTGISYAAGGQMSQEQFGTDTPVYNKLFYNTRQQLSEIRVSTTGGDTSWNRGAIINHYSTQCWGMCSGSAMTDNNGNLIYQDNYIPNNDQVSSYVTWRDQFTYDYLNRLTQVHEATGNSSLDLQQTFVYDRYGNRTINNNSGVTYRTGLPSMQASVDINTNRLIAPSGYAMTYDAAGNLITDTYTGSGDRHYDAENRMIDASAHGRWQNYSYDADGHRVKRVVDGTETWQVYGMGGELLAEYAANTDHSSPQKEYGYRNGQLLITATPGSSSRANVALATNGATAVGSTTLSPYNASNVIDGARRALNSNIWLDNTYASFPDWIEVDFSGSKTINEIDVITQQDDYANPVEPTLTQTFSVYGITNFDVQYWDGSTWVTVPNGSVTGNNKVWRQFTFSSITTSKIRVQVNGCADNVYSRVVEVEAWTPAPPVTPTNYALATNGATAVSSTTLSPYNANNVIDGSRRALNNNIWLDNTYQSFPDWIEVDFSGTKTISEIDVITQQDDYGNPVEPTLTQTFSVYGITSFDVQYWNGSTWVTVTNGSVTGNNKVWRQFTFSSITTNKIRVQVNGCADNVYSRVVEVEAWGSSSGSATSADIEWLVTDQLGTPRMVLDHTGSLANTKRHDYLPFGEELAADRGLRPQAQGYGGGDGVRQQFTQKERDIETGLDYFLSRCYSSTQGRFTSPDEFTGGPDELYEAMSVGNPTFYADLADPQSLNKYQYGYNNPLRYVDPDGHQGKEHVNEALKTGGQIIKDTVVGGAKEVANVVIDTSNAINSVLDYASGPFAMKFGQTERFEPSTRGERNAMIGVDAAMILEGGVSTSRSAAAAIESNRVASMVEEMKGVRAPATSEVAVETTVATTPYARPSGATTAAQRASVQGRPCSVCGESAPTMYAGHKEALVREHYRTGTINKIRMRSIDAVRPECPTCSGREGAEMARYSKVMKSQIPR